MENKTAEKSRAAESNRNIEKLDAAALRYFEAPANLIDEVADDVTNAAIPLILHYSRIYGGMLNREDLMQAGLEGLLKALKNFKMTFGASFTTYASHCIIGEIRHLVRKESKYYTPGFIVDKQKKADEFILKYIEDFGEAPTNDQISQHIGITEEGVPEIMRSKLVSFESIDSSKIKTIQQKTFKLPIEDRIVLWNAFKKITDIQRKVISLLFIEGYTQEETAKKLGTNQRQVSRIKQKGLEAMKKILKEN